MIYDVCKALSFSPCYCMVRNFVAVFTDVVLATMAKLLLNHKAVLRPSVARKLASRVLCVCVIVSLIHTIENKYGIPNL